MSRVRFAPLLLAGLLSACGGEDTPSPGDPGGSPPGTVVKLLSLRVSPDPVTVHAGLTVQLTATSVWSNGTESDATGSVTWTSSDPAIAVFDGAPGLLRGLAEGTVTVSAEHEGVRAEKSGQVAAPRVDILFLEGANDGETLTAGTPRTIVVKGGHSDGVERALDPATLGWSSSDEAVATVSAGVVQPVGPGAVTIRITAGDVSASIGFTVVPACTYPSEAARIIQYGGVFPRAKWAAAVNPDGSTFELDLGKVHCGEQFPDTKVIFFVVGTGWCPNCPTFIRRVHGIARQIEAAGGLLVYVEMQDENYEASDSQQSHTYIRRLLGANGTGIRVGDKDILRPLNLPFNRSPEIRSVPFVIAVRVSDMKYITDDNHFSTAFPFVAIANDPDMYDDSAPPAMCQPGTEEASEPNDTHDTPAPLMTNTPVSGGVCAAEPDYYWVDQAGPWRARLEFNNAVGNLNIYVWDPFTDRPFVERGVTIGSYSTTSGSETFDYSGQALLRVEGANGARAPYTLTLTPR